MASIDASPFHNPLHHYQLTLIKNETLNCHLSFLTISSKSKNAAKNNSNICYNHKNNLINI